MPEFAGAPCVLALRHVTAHAPDGTTLLDDVSFSADRGSLIAIVGPTGAGKTSLARALTGSLPVTNGDLFVNGTSAFVPQHDTLHLGLSLATALWYAAALRLPQASGDERADRVATVMKELGLVAHADTVVRDLSVGQRKRASVAAQLLGDPDVIVLDEPTAGLDPGYERVVLTILRELADAGRTIVTVTHSVDALRTCDRVLFLAAGGSVAFFGPPAKAAKYFNLADPADVFLALDTAPAQSWQDKFRAHPLHRKYVTDVVTHVTEPVNAARGVAANSAGQIALLTRRNVDLLKTDTRRLAILAVQGPLIGALLWAVMPAGGLEPTRRGGFGPHAAIVVLFLALSTTWLGVTNAIREIVKERAIIKSEVGAGLSPLAYVASKAITLGGLTVVQSAVIAFVATARQGGPVHGLLIGSARVELIGVAALAGFAACALGLAISAIAKSADKALAVLPMMLVTQLVLAGAWAQDSRVALIRQVRTLVGARWAMEAMQASLSHNGRQWWTALAATSALAVGGLVVATVQVARATRPARARRRWTMPMLPQLPRMTARPFAAVGAAAAVVMSLAAGTTGVVALVGAHHAAPAALAPPIFATPTTLRTVIAPVVTTPATTPTTAGPVVTVPVAPNAKVVASASGDGPIPKTTPVSIPTNPVANIVASPPPDAPSTGVLGDQPVATPVTTTTTPSPWAAWMRFFNPFAPEPK